MLGFGCQRFHELKLLMLADYGNQDSRLSHNPKPSSPEPRHQKTHSHPLNPKVLKPLYRYNRGMFSPRSRAYEGRMILLLSLWLTPSPSPVSLAPISPLHSALSFILSVFLSLVVFLFPLGGGLDK